MAAPVPGDFVEVVRVGDVPLGTFSVVEIDDEVLILAHAEEGFFAVSGWCSHQGTALALATLNGSVLMCCAHLWRFDVRSGEPTWPAIARIAPGYKLRTYPVIVRDDVVLVSRTPGPANSAA